MSADSTPADEATGEEVEAHPRGTFFLMLCFLGMIAVMWIWMFGILVDWWGA